jgi:two-component system sensor histidine kinase KdpD
VIRSVEPTSVARRACVRVTPAADGREIRLELTPTPGLPACETDASRLEQILVNLLGNAIAHSPAKSTIRVAITARDAKVEFVVEDEGPGIPKTEVERIFDIYVTKPAGESQGMGLGLPLSRRLARLLGGELRADPASDDRPGGRFVLELPASPES